MDARADLASWSAMVWVGVGRGEEGGGYLAEDGRALEDGDFVAAAGEGDSGGEAAEAGADDEDVEGVGGFEGEVGFMRRGGRGEAVEEGG